MANKKHTDTNTALIEKKRWGVPTWTSNQGYPKNSDAKDKWKWEFLRRTDEYRNDWERACNKMPPSSLKSGKQHSFLTKKPFNKTALAKKYRLTKPVPPTVSYDKLPEGFSFMRLPIASTGGYIVYPKKAVPDLNRKKLREPLKNKASGKIDLEELALKIPHYPPSDWYEMRVWVEYDLSYSLDEQLKRADDTLHDAQKKLKLFMANLGEAKDADDYGKQKVGVRKERGADRRNDFKEMEKLLRIIDAKRSVTGNNKIARILYDLGFGHMDDSTVSKSYKVALQFWKEL